MIAYNVTDVSNQLYQPGGMVTMILNDTTHRVLNTGIDDSKLGKWTWILF